jgi:hypothetical protein
MKSSLWNRGATFRPLNAPLPARNGRARHPILGVGAVNGGPWTTHAGLVYDAETGAAMTRESLLALPFFYDGTLHRVPVEIALWAFAQESSLDISWMGLSINGIVEAGYGLGKTDDDAAERLPEEDYSRVGVFLPDTPETSPVATHPQPSVAITALRDRLEFSTGSYPQGSTYGGIGVRNTTEPESWRFTGSGSSTRCSLSVAKNTEGDTGEEEEADTGVPIGEGTYLLRYVHTLGAANESVALTVGHSPALFLARYGVWVAPVSASGTKHVYDQSTEILTDDTFNVLYPEYGAILDEVIASITADDHETITYAVPAGLGRISLTPVSEWVENPKVTQKWGAEVSAGATVVRQFERFLPFQLNSSLS